MKKILNIILGILLAVMAVLGIYAIATGGSEAAISLNLIWCYFLLALAVFTAIFCAVFGMIQNPAGIKGTIISLALIIVIVGVAYFVASGHDIQIPDLANGGFFSQGETVLTDTSILVTYVALVAAFVTAIATEIYGAFKYQRTMAGNKRQIQEINAGSMADIAFLLLIFFLVATTMNVDTGLVRMLPPMPPENQKQEDIKVKERNLFLVLISGSGNIMAGPSGKQEIIDLRQLKDKTKEFILNPMDDENLPEKTEKEIELADGSKWVYPESQGVVSLQTTRDTGYQSYIMVQNELTRAFNEVRDEVAMKKFGAKFSELSEDQRNAVSKAVPLKISEAEPRNIKK